MNRRTSFLLVGLLWVAVLGTLALASLPARGQPVVFPLVPCVERAALPLPAPTEPAGKPLQWGGQCSLSVHTSTVGAAAAMFCPRPGGGAPLTGLYAVRWAAITPAMASDFAALPFQPAASAVEFQRKYQTAHVLDMCDVWGPARERFNAAFAANTTAVQPPALWRVAPFGVQPTRPAFGVLAGKRGPQSPTRAPIGATCDCAAPIIEGAVTYCPWVQSGGLVTVCTQRQ